MPRDFIPEEKMSKKQKKALHDQKRAQWGDVKPVTRRIESKKTYTRKNRGDAARIPPFFLPLMKPIGSG